MKVWKLIAHHEEPAQMSAWAEEQGRIAVGWGRIGDLREGELSGAQEISRRIAAAYPELNNAHTGGPSLWNFVRDMSEGDLVLLAGGGQRFGVFEITGPYSWMSLHDSLGDYQHQRTAVPTEHDPEVLWEALERSVAPGEAMRWTVALCTSDGELLQASGEPIAKYSEGTRYAVNAVGIERSPRARQACLAHHGVKCMACGIAFGEIYGEIGQGFMHVHHLKPIGDSSGTREVDPVRDLIPLCPNCHAMVHRRNPPLTVSQLKQALA
ncbi:MAG: HNH endonuclease [Planctomycetota bacterium]